MPFNTEDFRANGNRKGLEPFNPASPAYFELSMQMVPRIFQDHVGLSVTRESIKTNRNIYASNDNLLVSSARIKIRCMGSDLPARLLETQERIYTGPSRLIPYGMIYGNLNVQMIEDDKLSMREFFEAWQDFCFTGGELHNRPLYYDDIVTDLYLDIYNKSGENIRTYRFYDCFPISINPTQLGWAEENQMLIVPIEFAYHQWISIPVDITKKRKGPHNVDHGDGPNAFVDALKRGLMNVASKSPEAQKAGAQIAKIPTFNANFE